ncbi:MAG: hypothetical protein QM811_24535 [Pirellulales bacterium]
MVDDLFNKIEARPEAEVTAAEKAVLKARYMSRKGEVGSSLATLEKLRSDDPTNVSYWLEWSTLDLANRKPVEILDVIATAPESVRKSPVMLIAQANLWTYVGGDAGKSGLIKLLESAPADRPEERMQLQLLVGQSLTRLGDIAGAKAVAATALAQTLETKPREMRPFRLQADIAVQTGDLDMLENTLTEMRKFVSQDDDYYRYARSQYLVLKVRTAGAQENSVRRHAAWCSTRPKPGI